MEPIRILLVDIPHLLCEIVESMVADEPDLVLVDHSDPPSELLEEVERSDADFVLVGAAESTSRHIPAVLADRPHLRAVAVVDHGRRGVLYELRRARLNELSRETLLDIVRTKPAWNGSA